MRRNATSCTLIRLNKESICVDYVDTREKHLRITYSTIVGVEWNYDCIIVYNRE